MPTVHDTSTLPLPPYPTFIDQFNIDTFEQQVLNGDRIRGLICCVKNFAKNAASRCGR